MFNSWIQSAPLEMLEKGVSIPLVLNISGLWFWMFQSFGRNSEYASGFEYAMILNIQEFWIYQDYTWFKICLNSSWICLVISGYFCFCFTFSHFPICFTVLWLLEHVITCMNVCRRLQIILWRDKIYQSIAIGSIWFVFCFRLDIFTIKI